MYYSWLLIVADEEEQSGSEEEYDEDNPMSVEEWLPNRMKVRERERERTREREREKEKRGKELDFLNQPKMKMILMVKYSKFEI